MSDFLTRIAQLSRGEARLIAPRLPSLFAPTANYDMASATETIHRTVQPADTATVNEKTKQAPVVNTANAETFQPVPPAEPSIHSVWPQKPVKGKADKVEEAATSVEAPRENNSPESNRVAPLPVTSQEPAAISQAESGRNQTHSSPVEILQTIVPLDVAVPSDVAVDRNDQPGSLIPQSSLQLVPDYKIQDPTPQKVISQLPSSRETTGQQETAVHINIGRVEVRAQAAAPITAPRPARPKDESSLSLHDYLSRSGGRS